MARKPFKIRNPGALTRDIGGKPSKRLGAVRRLAKHGTPAQRRRANFFLSVLHPANRRRKKKRG